jgi:hypothetical protein
MGRDSLYVALVSVAVGVGLTAANGGLPGSRPSRTSDSVGEVAAPDTATTLPTIELDTPPVTVVPREAASLATSVVTATGASTGPGSAAPAEVVNPQSPAISPPTAPSAAPVTATAATPPAPAPAPTSTTPTPAAPAPEPEPEPTPQPADEPQPTPAPAPEPSPAPDPGLLPDLPLPPLPLSGV